MKKHQRQRLLARSNSAADRNAPLTTKNKIEDACQLDPLLTELLNALHRADTSSLVLALCDEILARAHRVALRELIAKRLHELVPVFTEPAAGLICHLLGVGLELVVEKGTTRWTLPAELADPHQYGYSSALGAYQAVVVMRFPRKDWEAQVDLGLVRTRYWAWALVKAVELLDEQVQQ